MRSVRRAWAGLRTFAPDRVPVLGEDPDAPGFWWLVGQGGAGIKTAPAMAALLTAQMTGADTGFDDAASSAAAGTATFPLTRSDCVTAPTPDSVIKRGGAALGTSWSGEWTNCHIIRNATAISSAANSRFDVVSLIPTEIFEAAEGRDDAGDADDGGHTEVDVVVRAVAHTCP